MESSLFQPFKVGSMELPNRFVRSASYDGLADPIGGPTDQSIQLYRNLGQGGIGLIVTGFAYVSPMGQAAPNQYGIYDDRLIPGWKRVTEAVHSAGESKIAMQIVHCGINSFALRKEGKVLLAVSKIELKRPHREMTDDEIEGIIDGFAAAAVRAREAGFDAVQLHGAHGYLFSQFASPLYNLRTDRWGGSPENRRRFHLEVIRRIRSSVGRDFPLFIKFGVQDDKPVGMPLEDGLEISRRMEENGIDAIEVSGGVGRISSRGAVDKPEFRDRTAAVKRTVSIPVMMVNGIRSLTTAEDIIRSGDADIISMARPFIREPHLLLRWHDEQSSAAKCISCDKCFPILEKGEGLHCGEERRISGLPVSNASTVKPDED